MSKKVVVGITHSVKQSKITLCALKFAVWQGGGIPLLINTNTNQENYDYDSLILAGGVDIHPEQYGGEVKPNYCYEQERDFLEKRHIHHTTKCNKPILGICRGAQLLNVSLGGNLYPDIRKIDEKAKYPINVLGYVFFRKFISIKKNSLLFQILGKDRIKVNSLHSQAIYHTGEQLRITAHEDNRIVQAIEHKNHPWFLGVQFHPEFMLHKRCFRKIFSALIHEANGKI